MYKIRYGTKIPFGIQYSTMNCDDTENVKASLLVLEEKDAIDIVVIEEVDVTKEFLNE